MQLATDKLADATTKPDADNRADKPTETEVSDDVEEIRQVLEAKLGLGFPKEPETDKVKYKRLVYIAIYILCSI